ncbi:MAG: radical SAM family heme chaperone HemW [Succinivibrionaceae bacterium]
MEISLNNQKLPNLSLYIHLPWCVRKCPYCDFNSYCKPNNSSLFELYIKALKRELSFIIKNSNFFIQNREIMSIYFGGGTPSLFSPSLLYTLLSFISNNFNLSEDIEISMEMNPGTVSKQTISEYKSIGINRVSIGVQSLNDNSLRLLERIHNKDCALKSIELIKEYFSNFNVDIMHSLPKQSTKETLEDLKQILQFSPPHISWYQLTIEEDTKFGKKTPEEMPSDDIIENNYLLGYDLLKKNNFEHYEISAFAKNNNYCKHNVNYWEYGDYLAIGAGAHSKVSIYNESILNVFRQERVQNPLEYIKYISDLETQKLKDISNINSNLYVNKFVPINERPFEFFLNRFRLFNNINFSEFYEKTGCEFSTILPKLQNFEEDNLIAIDFGKNLLKLTKKGHLFVNHMLEELL